MFRQYSADHEVDNLIAKGRYSRAIKLLRERLEARPRDVQLRQKLADTLARDGGEREAVTLLEPLVEWYANDGFLAKAMAIVKKIQRIDPEHHDLDAELGQLTRLCEESAALDPPGLLRPRLEPVVPLKIAEEVRVFQHSPLFGDFSPGELCALIRGLELLSFASGEIVISEGEPGSSLLVLASGSVRVYVRNELNHQVEVRRLGPGSFFGEISILTGQARTATVTAAESCEILELDRFTLQRIGEERPRVVRVIQELCERRAGSPEEMAARQEIELPL